MKKNKNVLYKIKKIGELMGEKTVFRIGVNTRNGRIDLLSVDVCFPEQTKEIIAEIPDYIG